MNAFVRLVKCALTTTLTIALIATHANAQTRTFVATNGYKEGSDLKAVLNTVASNDENIQEIAFTHDGDWVVVTDQRFEYSNGFPVNARITAGFRWNAGDVIDEIAVTTDDKYLIVTSGGVWNNLAGEPSISTLVNYANTHQNQINDIIFDSDGYGVSVQQVLSARRGV